MKVLDWISGNPSAAASVLSAIIAASVAILVFTVWQLHTETPPDLADVVDASGRVGHFLRLMEQEIITNRDYLLSDHILPKRYKKTSQTAIEAEIPPPDGPIMSPGIGN